MEKPLKGLWTELPMQLHSAILRRSAALSRTHAVMVAGLLFVGLGILAVAVRPVQAGFGDLIWLALAYILHIFVGWIGQLLLIMVGALIYVAQYNDFVNSAAVANGWSIVRDVTNMFFIVVLLVIAFGTMLGADQYSYKNKMLSRLLIMAIVVNFSRTICGLLIDFGQVVMLTFVNGFKEAAGGNFADALRITRLMQLRVSGDEEEGTSMFGLAVSMMLALVMVTISLCVIVIMTVLLVIRIVYLWLLIVMSPLAFFLKAVPGGKASGYYAQWWSIFTSQVAFGPVMAFFLWLSLVSVTGNQLQQGFPTAGMGTGEGLSGGFSEAFQIDEIQAFIIAICLLIGGTQMGLKMAQEAPGFSKALGAAKGAPAMAVRAGKAAGRAAGSIPIPGTKGEGGVRMNLASLGGAGLQRFKDSKMGKSALFNKETRADVAQQRNLAALRATGQKDAADRLEKSLVGTGAKGMSEKYTPSQLRKIKDSDGASQLDRQRAMLALAQKGDESLKGKGAELTKMVGGVGGSKDFEMEVRKALKASGDEDAMMMNADQVKDRMSTLSAKQKAGALEGIDKAVEPGADGRPKQIHAADKLLALDKSDFDQFSQRLKDKVSEALVKAAHLENDPAKKAALEKQYQDLGAKLGPGMDASSVIAAMEGREVKGRVEKAERGELPMSGADRVAADLIKADAQNSFGATLDADSLYKALSVMQDPNSTPADINNAKAGIDSALQSSLALGAAMDFAGEAAGFDEKGNPMSHQQALDQSQFVQDLKSALAATDPKVAADHLKTAAIQIENASQGLSEKTRKIELDNVSRQRSRLASSGASFDRALSEVRPEDRRKAVSKASNEATTSLKRLEASVTVSPEIKNQIKDLRKLVDEIKGAKVVDDAVVNKINKVKQDIDTISKKV